MSEGRILLFDSGMGGLTVARSVRHELPFAHLVYSADNAAFPYGAWEEQKLVKRILFVMDELIRRVEPDVVVIACNTASTIALGALRETFGCPSWALCRRSSRQQGRPSPGSWVCWPRPEPSGANTPRR
jgi:glutamate racemase